MRDSTLKLVASKNVEDVILGMCYLMKEYTFTKGKYGHQQIKDVRLGTGFHEYIVVVEYNNIVLVQGKYNLYYTTIGTDYYTNVVNSWGDKLKRIKIED